MKARTLLLMLGLSLAGTAAADPIDAPHHGPYGWLFGAPPEGYDLLRRAPEAAAPQPRQSGIVPLPRPRPYAPQTSGVTQVDALNPPIPSPVPRISEGVPIDIASTPMSQPPPAETARNGPVIQVRADGEAMSEVLADISKAVDLRYRTSIQLDATVSAAYSGPADTVVTRLLSDNGYSFAISHRGETIVVSVYGRWLTGVATEKFASNPIPAPALTPAPLQPSPAREQQHLAAEQGTPGRPASPPPEPRVPWGIAHHPH